MRALECILAEQKRRVGASRCQNRGKIYGPRREAVLGHEGQKKTGERHDDEDKREKKNTREAKRIGAEKISSQHCGGVSKFSLKNTQWKTVEIKPNSQLD